MDRINQVHRQLVWAEMRDGVPQVLGYAPRMYLEQEEFQELSPVEITTSIGQQHDRQETPAPEETPGVDPPAPE